MASYIYQIAKADIELIDGCPVPKQITALVKWRWLGSDPWWYCETDTPLVGPVPAPAKYPNGVDVKDAGCVETFITGKPVSQVEKQVTGMTDGDLLVAVAEAKRRGLPVTEVRYG